MRNLTQTLMKFGLGMTLTGMLALPAQAQLITNGGFEVGLAGWTRLDQTGSDGTFFAQSGGTSPLNGFPVVSPPEGVRAAMTDAGAGGSHVLYQNFVVPSGVQNASLIFEAFINSDANFIVPANLDWAATNRAGGLNLNQQARVDIMTATADPFSVGSGDILRNLFQTHPNDPLTAGYTTVPTDITALLQAHQGETLRLRFAEVDNVSFFNFGVDNVRLSVQAVPEPSSLALLMGLCGSAGWLLHTRRSKSKR